MEQSLLVINGVSSEKPIAGIAQTGKDLAVLVELLVDCTNSNTNVGLFFSQFHQTIAAGNDAQDVNLGNAPLRPTRQICNNNMLAHEIDSQDAIDSEMQCRLHRVNCSRMNHPFFRSHLLEHFHDAHDGITGGHDGIQDVGDVALALLGEAVVVLDRHQVLPVHANVMDAGIRQKFQHALGHSQAGAEDRDDGDPLGNLVAGGINVIVAQGDVERHGLGGEGRRGLVSKVERYLSECPSEFAG